MTTDTVKTRDIAAEAMLEGTGISVIRFRMLENGCLVTEREFAELRDSGMLHEK